MTGAGRCPDCGTAAPYGRRCRECWAARIARYDEVKAFAAERSAARKEARGGRPGRFRVRSTFLGYHVSWGSCETREEAFREAALALDEFPEATAALVEEIVRYEFGRERREAA